MKSTYDYIVVGAGPAGCITAARLSEDPDVEVLLIEAGGSDRGLFFLMPLALPFVYQNERVKWGHVSGPEPHLGGRTINEQGGKIIGGSSTINAMIFNRGNPLDFENWSTRAGLHEWDWDHVLPYFKKLEAFSEGGNDWRGGSGPVRISRAQAKHKLFDSFLEAGRQAGFEVAEDHNGFKQEGMHIAQVNIHNGERYSAARAYLKPALQRENLTLLPHTSVDRIHIDRGRASGVHIRRRGEPSVIIAEKEVIVSAGAMNSPKLLMLSGIGPESELTKHGIRAVVDSREVGMNVQNHPGVDVQFSTSAADSMTSDISLLKRPLFGSRWLLNRRGLGGSNLFEAGAFLRTRDTVEYPNMQYEFLPLCRKVVNGKVVPVPGFQVWMDLSRPQSRGRMTLSSADPDSPMRTVFNTYAEPQDLQDVIDGVRLLRDRVASQPALQQYSPTELNPGVGMTSEREMEEWVRASTGTSYHASSSCRMGTDESSVVDPVGRVRGVESLRVVDASIIPLTVTANLQATVLMLSEKIADSIRGRTPLVESGSDYFGKEARHG